MSLSPARRVAFQVLRRVSAGGFASDLLRHACEGLDSRDAALAHEIVFGVLRHQSQLDFLIDLHARGRLDTEVRLALRIGAYQLRHLTRVPLHAAVNECVELVKLAHKRSAAGLTNAVLRKIERGPVDWPDRATRLAMPQWLLDRWDRQFGAEHADRIANAVLKPPELHRLGERVQDVGAQSIVPLLDIAPGETMLDLCAAPGNKTAQAIALGARVIAADVSLERLTSMPPPGCPLVVLDGVQPLPFSRPFDRILVDAPCSGTGTLARNPEIKWRLTEADLTRFRARQVELLRNALTVLAPGGRVVYSTCSLEREENEDVVREAWEIPPLREAYRLPGLEPGDGFYSAVLTSK